MDNEGVKPPQLEQPLKPSNQNPATIQPQSEPASQGQENPGIFHSFIGGMFDKLRNPELPKPNKKTVIRAAASAGIALGTTAVVANKIYNNTEDKQPSVTIQLQGNVPSAPEPTTYIVNNPPQQHSATQPHIEYVKPAPPPEKPSHTDIFLKQQPDGSFVPEPNNNSQLQRPNFNPVHPDMAKGKTEVLIFRKGEPSDSSPEEDIDPSKLDLSIMRLAPVAGKPISYAESNASPMGLTINGKLYVPWFMVTNLNGLPIDPKTLRPTNVPYYIFQSQVIPKPAQIQETVITSQTPVSVSPAPTTP